MNILKEEFKIFRKIKEVDAKVIISGDIIELYNYEKPVLSGFSQPTDQIKTRLDDIGSAERKERDRSNKKRSLQRTDQRLRRLINSNIGRHGRHSDKFVTLTFQENIKEHEVANKEFRNFIRRLNYFVFKKQSGLAYIAVIERQERGALHYHTIFFNLPYISHEKLLHIWRNGVDKRGLNIKKIDNIDNVGAYIVKYIKKDIAKLIYGSEVSLRTAYKKGKKLYFRSKNLYKPIERGITKEEFNGMVKEFGSDSRYESFDFQYNNEYRGDIYYYQFKKKNGDD